MTIVYIVKNGMTIAEVKTSDTEFLNKVFQMIKKLMQEKPLELWHYDVTQR